MPQNQIGFFVEMKNLFPSAKIQTASPTSSSPEPSQQTNYINLALSQPIITVNTIQYSISNCRCKFWKTPTVQESKVQETGGVAFSETLITSFHSL